jgi:hypothetical protein
MAYDISLDRDLERGLDRYTITLDKGFNAGEAHEVGDWLTAAAQNPTATFRIDVTGVPRLASSRPLATLLTRSAWLRARRRVEVVRRQLASLSAVAPLVPLTF